MRFFPGLILLGIAVATVVNAENEFPLSSPELSGIMQDMTMYISYDDESLEPDSSIGENPLVRIDKVPSGPVFEPGISGKALMLGSASGFYQTDRNVTIKSNGSAIFWVKPVGWSDKDVGNSTFLRLTSNDFFVLWQSPKAGKRNAALMFIAKNIGDKRGKNVYWADTLKNGQWHMFAINWEWPSFSMSIDGNKFVSKSLSQSKKFKENLIINVGTRWGAKGLIDEVLFFSRPLSIQEVKKLYQIMNPKKENK